MTSRYEHAGENPSRKTDNKTFLIVEEFRCLRTILTNQSFIHLEIKSSWLLSLVQSILSSSLLSKNVKIKVCRRVILLVILYGHISRFLTIVEERRLRVFENRVLRKIFGPKWNDVTMEWRRLHTEEFVICITHQIFFRWSIKIISWAGHVACMGNRRQA